VTQSNGDTVDTSGLASYAPTVTVIGGAGSGLISVTYDDLISVGPTLFMEFVSASAGDLGYSQTRFAGDLTTIVLTDSISTGFLSFTFGQPMILPTMTATLSSMTRGPNGAFEARRSIVGFDVRTTDGLIIPGAQVLFTPEPATSIVVFWSSVLFVFRRLCRRT
jgi:hypothetical protein